MDFFKILNGGIGVSMSNFDRLWAKKYSGWPETELTGLLPLSFLSKGEALADYRIYGTANGAGVETENLYPLSKKSFTVTRNGKTITVTCDGTGAIYFSGKVSEISSLSQEWVSNFSFALQAGTYYTQNTPSQSAFNQLGRFIRKKSDSSVILQPGTNSFTLSETTEVYLAFYIYNGSGDVTWQACLTEGSTAPTSYIPYGYKIPISNTSGVTENLVEGVVEDVNINSQGVIVSSTFDVCYGKIKQGEQYISTANSYSMVIAFFENIPAIGSTSYDAQRIVTGDKQYLFTAPITGYAVFRVSAGFTESMLTSGSTPPDHYIPHRYESNYDLFIGDTQLGEEEYVDFGEGKVYKRTENLFNYMAQDTENGFLENAYLFSNGLANSSLNYNISEYIEVLPNTTYAIAPCVGNTPGVCEYDSGKTYITGIAYHNEETITFTTTATTKYIRFSVRNTIDTEIMVVQGSTVPASYIPYLQPTDPPLALPAIQAYQGENTLSSSETVGEVTIKGRIKETT